MSPATASDAMPEMTCLTSRFRKVRRPPSASPSPKASNTSPNLAPPASDATEQSSSSSSIRFFSVCRCVSHAISAMTPALRDAMSNSGRASACATTSQRPIGEFLKSIETSRPHGELNKSPAACAAFWCSRKSERSATTTPSVASFPSLLASATPTPKLVRGGVLKHSDLVFFCAVQCVAKNVPLSCLAASPSSLRFRLF
mmetsp:Transcript_4177/g.15311  ORF Transcript_4177/g.15311 Transcript_4177/m.15311 type:complete len:200 (+) Transcript_4177:359-958(+)